jgi:hypothetical protein
MGDHSVNVSERWGFTVSSQNTADQPRGWRVIDLSIEYLRVTLSIAEAEALSRELARMIENAKRGKEAALTLPLSLPPAPAPVPPLAAAPAAPPPPRRKRELTDEQRQELAERLRRGREAAAAARAGQATEGRDG